MTTDDLAGLTRLLAEHKPIIRADRIGNPVGCPCMDRVFFKGETHEDHVAAVIAAAGWVKGRELEPTHLIAEGWTKQRRVTSDAELDALGFQTVVMSADREVWRLALHSADNLDEDGTRVYDKSAVALPATVLYEPGEGQ